MALKDLIPWNRGRDVTIRRGETPRPFLSLQREMNCLFDEAFRGFDLAPFGISDRFFGGGASWPNIEVAETHKEIKVIAELPGLDEKDIDVHLANGVLSISGEKHAEMEDKDGLFSDTLQPVSLINPDNRAQPMRHLCLALLLICSSPAPAPPPRPRRKTNRPDRA